jgi:hypothetical protein
MDFTPNSNKISKYFDLPRLAQTNRNEVYAQEDATHKNTIPVENNAYIFGLEVEVENISNPKVTATYRSYWTVTTDTSLRNNGVEFVSIPLKMSQIEGAIDQLTTNLPTTHEFSPRTSVHVHMNVRDLSLEQITNLLLLYTTIEELLFKWVGHERDTNIFCIKLTETEYADSYMKLQINPINTVQYWNKYTALNLHPMQEKGTVEFRHMHGTCDKVRLLTWINMLACLKTAAKKRNLNSLIKEIQELNSSSMYEIFISKIFNEYTPELLPFRINIKSMMEDAISYIKIATIQVTPPQQVERPRTTLNPPTNIFTYLAHPVTPFREGI